MRGVSKLFQTILKKIIFRQFIPKTFYTFNIFFPVIFFLLFLQDEKAEGLVNISSYNIESAGEHKRK